MAGAAARMAKLPDNSSLFTSVLVPASSSTCWTRLRSARKSPESLVGPVRCPSTSMSGPVPAARHYHRLHGCYPLCADLASRGIDAERGVDVRKRLCHAATQRFVKFVTRRGVR
jgi:hypothetical protein